MVFCQAYGIATKSAVNRFICHFIIISRGDAREEF